MSSDTKTRGHISENGKMVLSIVQWALAVMVLPSLAFVMSLDRDVTELKAKVEQLQREQIATDANFNSMSSKFNDLSQGVVRIETTMTAIKESLDEVREELRDNR